MAIMAVVLEDDLCPGITAEFLCLVVFFIAIKVIGSAEKKSGNATMKYATC